MPHASEVTAHASVPASDTPFDGAAFYVLGWNIAADAAFLAAAARRAVFTRDPATADHASTPTATGDEP